MGTKECKVIVHSDSDTITITELALEELTITYGSDVDLTELVVSFAKLINTGENVTLTMPHVAADERVSLVLATIKDIADSYNAVLVTKDADSAEKIEPWDEDDIPF